MPDGLDAAIRARLEGWTPPPAPDDAVFIPGADLRWTDEDVERWRELVAEARAKPLRVLPPGPKLYPGFDEMRDAIEAVLDLHRAASEDFTHIDETAYEFARRSALEEAVRAIAGKLGVEADGG